MQPKLNANGKEIITKRFVMKPPAQKKKKHRRSEMDPRSRSSREYYIWLEKF